MNTLHLRVRGHTVHTLHYEIPFFYALNKCDFWNCDGKLKARTVFNVLIGPNSLFDADRKYEEQPAVSVQAANSMVI